MTLSSQIANLQEVVEPQPFWLQVSFHTSTTSLGGERITVKAPGHVGLGMEQNASAIQECSLNSATFMCTLGTLQANVSHSFHLLYTPPASLVDRQEFILRLEADHFSPYENNHNISFVGSVDVSGGWRAQELGSGCSVCCVTLSQLPSAQTYSLLCFILSLAWPDASPCSPWQWCFSA